MRTTKTSVNKMLFSVLLSLAVMVFAQMPVVNAEDNVTRPFHISGQITFFEDYSIVDTGVATHFGRFVDIGTWFGGTFTVANGDQVYYEAISFEYDPETNTYSGLNRFTGGTGRFEGATGEFTYTMTQIEGPADGMNFAYTGEGTLTY